MVDIDYGRLSKAFTTLVPGTTVIEEEQYVREAENGKRDSVKGVVSSEENYLESLIGSYSESDQETLLDDLYAGDEEVWQALGGEIDLVVYSAFLDILHATALRKGIGDPEVVVDRLDVNSYLEWVGSYDGPFLDSSTGKVFFSISDIESLIDDLESKA